MKKGKHAILLKTGYSALHFEYMLNEERFLMCIVVKNICNEKGEVCNSSETWLEWLAF